MMRSRLAALGALGAVAVLAACGPPPTSDGESLGSGPWRWSVVRTQAVSRSQGLATDPTDATGATWYTSQFSLERANAAGASLGTNGAIPPDIATRWKVSHTGDPDAVGGRVVVPWENKQLGPSSPPAKVFGVFDGGSLAYLGGAAHVLAPSETNDNPWVAISGDGRFVMTGRYAPMPVIEVYPMPRAPYPDLPLVATIPIDAPPSAVQGCDVVDDTTLVCASDDEASGKQAFTLTLDAPLGSNGRGATSATLAWQGSIPQAEPLLAGPLGAACPPSGEVEGIDAAPAPGGVAVRALVIDRCLLVVHEYRHLIPSGGAPG